MAVLEGIVNVWGGVYTWGGLRPEVSFFPGTWHQYSPLEPIAFGFLFGASVVMAHSTVLNGGSPKFLDGLPEVTGRRRAALRQLAVLGFVNSAILLYNLAVIIQSVPRQWIPGLPKMFLG